MGAWRFIVDETVSPEPVETDPARQCAALIYTTGTTGAPKGVMLSHRNVLFIAAMSSTLRRVTPEDVVYAVLPITHIYGLASVCLGSLYAGATLRLAPRFAPDAVRRALAEENVSIFQGVPAMHAKLVEQVQTSGTPWRAPALRFAYSGGSPLDAALKARVEGLYKVPLHNGYGMTESSPTISQTMLDAPRDDCSAGDPIPGIELRFVALDGVDVAPGEVGELWVRGPNVMLGYYRNEAQTRATVTEDGWLRTGDLARQAEDGALYIVGRSKELIIRSGFNVYPAEVENVLNSHPDVLQSAVIGRAGRGQRGSDCVRRTAAVGACAARRYRPVVCRPSRALQAARRDPRAGRTAGGIDGEGVETQAPGRALSAAPSAARMVIVMQRLQPLTRDVGVDLRRGNIGMAEQHLHHA